MQQSVRPHARAGGSRRSFAGWLRATGTTVAVTAMAAGGLGLHPTIAGAAATGPASAAVAATVPEYIALAFSPSLKAVREGRGNTATHAMGVAVNGCLQYARERPSLYHNDCAPYVWARNGWVALAASGRAPRELDWAWGSAWGRTRQEAERRAMDECHWNGGGLPGRAECTMVGGSPFPSDSVLGKSANPRRATAGGRPTFAWPTAPLPPTDVSARLANATTFRVSWARTSYFAQSAPDYWEVNNGVESRRVSVNPDKRFVTYDWAVAPNQYMCVRVRAVNKQGSSWWAPNSSPWWKCAGSVAYPPKGTTTRKALLVTKAFVKNPERPGDVLFTRTIGITAGSSLILSTTADGRSKVQVDDLMTIKVTHRDGTHDVFTHDFTTGGCAGLAPAGPFDLQKYLKPGYNELTFTLSDKCGVSSSTPDLYLVGDFENVGTAS